MMNFEEFIISLAKLKKVDMAKEDIDMSYADAISELKQLLGDLEHLKRLYDRYIIGTFNVGCPRRANRVLMQEETGIDAGCITNSNLDCLECWIRVFDWMENKIGFWRLDDEI